MLTTGGTKVADLGVHNPLRYRGYVYDPEFGLYYLQSRYYDPELGRFINADVFTSTGQGLTGNNMFAYCNNNPSCCSDPTGMFGWTAAGIIFSGIIGGIVSATSTAMAGGSLAETIISGVTGAITAGFVAGAAALGAASSAITTGTVAIAGAVIGACGEIASLATEYSIYSNNDDYEFDWASGASRVAYAAGMGALSGAVSFGLGKVFSGALEPIGTLVSAEATVALGLVDFGIRKIMATDSSSPSGMAGVHKGLRGGNKYSSIAYMIAG